MLPFTSLCMQLADKIKRGELGQQLEEGANIPANVWNGEHNRLWVAFADFVTECTLWPQRDKKRERALDMAQGSVKLWPLILIVKVNHNSTALD
jgi:hypothetical protein